MHARSCSRWKAEVADSLLDLRPDHLKTVREILSKNIPGIEVWAFGSRAKWTAKEYSDLDLAVITRRPLDIRTSAALADDFSESDLPFRVDVVDWASTSESFRKIIENDKVVVSAAPSESGSTWGSAEIGSFAKLRSGYSFRSADWKEAGVPVIKIANVKAGRIVAAGCGFVDAMVAAEAKDWLTQPGDVLMAMTGYVGEVARVQRHEKYLINQRVGRFEFFHGAGVLPAFFFYVLQHPEIRQQIEGIARGSAQPNLSSSDLHKLRVPVPPLPMQVEIAAALTSLDDRIALLRETNATLEAIAQALFKSWFVDFDPVRAKSQGLAPVGMDEATAALFPDGFEESAFGPVPKGWRYAKFEEFVQRLPVGKKFDQRSALAEGLVPILDQGKSGIIGFHNETPGVLANLDSPIVVFANHTCVMRLITYNFSAIQNVLPFRGKHMDTVWAYFATKDRVRFSEYKGHWPDFCVEDAVVPDEAPSLRFRDAVDPLMHQIRGNEQQAQTLATLRDTLLPRLISGQLRLPEGHG